MNSSNTQTQHAEAVSGQGEVAAARVRTQTVKEKVLDIVLAVLIIMALAASLALAYHIARLKSVSNSESAQYRRNAMQYVGALLENTLDDSGEDAQTDASLEESLSQTDLSQAFLVNAEGVILTRLYADASGDSVVEALADAEYSHGSHALLAKGLADHYADEIEYALGGEAYTLLYMPSTIEGASRIAIFHAETGAEKQVSFDLIIRLLILVLVLTFLCVGLYMGRNRMRIATMLYVDCVTGGNSYQKFEKDAQRILSDGHASYAMITSSIAQFRLLGEHLGHVKSDAILTAFWQAIRKDLQGNETAGRLNDDHFCLLLQLTSMESLSERLCAIDEHLVKLLEQREIQTELAVSYGVYAMNTTECTIRDALDKADIACAAIVDHAGLTSIGVYDALIRDKLVYERRLEDRMRGALDGGCFDLMVQPKVQLVTGQATGGELLLRWRDSELGQISPSAFIPLFERNGFILQLDLFVFEETCRMLMALQEAGIPSVTLSFNLSDRRLRSLDTLNEFQEILKRYDVPANLIEFELTEASIYEDAAALCAIIDRIHDIGCRCSIDHFGSGYSSLGMLQGIHADALKLDKRFFAEIEGNQRVLIIASGLIKLADSLGFMTIAEGVETNEQVANLAGAGCDMVQGYVFSKPIPQQQFIRMLKSGIQFRWESAR